MMRNWEDMVKYYKDHPDECDAILKHAGLLKKEEPKMNRFVKNPDEIVWEDVKMVHYETMEKGRAVWLGIYLNNGKMYHLNIGGDKLWVNYSDETPE